MNGETRREIIEGFPESAAEYLGFLTAELGETFGASFFQIHHPAPSDMTPEQLEVVTDDLRAIGWNAELVPMDTEADSPLGVRIRP